MDRKVVEISKWGRTWIAALRVFPGDGTFPDGYTVTHDPIPGGKRGIPAAVREIESHGLMAVVVEG